MEDLKAEFAVALISQIQFKHQSRFSLPNLGILGNLKPKRFNLQFLHRFSPFDHLPIFFLSLHPTKFGRD